MKPKTLMLTVVAVVCGLAASYMTTRYLANQPAAEVEEVDVLVVMKPMAMGDIIKDEKVLGKKKFPKNVEPKGAITDVKEIKGKMLKRSLRAEDWITADDLYSQNDGLQYHLPDGYRAVGIRVTNEAIASGFAALPHSRVDITLTVRRGDDTNSFSKVLLEDVLVLAADTKSARGEGADAMPAAVVTVALKPEDVVKVNLAKDMGTLSLALRKFGEGKATKQAHITAREVIMGASVAPKEETKVVVAPPVKEKEKPVLRTHRIRLLFGSEVRHLTPVTLDEKGEVIEPEVSVTPLSEDKPDPKEVQKNKPQKDKAVTPPKEIKDSKKEVLFDNNRLVKGFKDRDGCFYKLYDLKMVRGNTYVIEMSSKDFDTYLLLEDGNGQLLDQDDDGGDGEWDSRIVFRPKMTDSYRILASTFLIGATGNYLIQVHEYFGRATAID